MSPAATRIRSWRAGSALRGSLSRVGPQNDPDPENVMTPVPDREAAQDAALDAVEPERLLAGEDEHSTYVDDAVHWTKVYTELLDFKRSLLTLAEQEVAAMDEDAASEVRETDLKVLRAEAARFQRRLGFWQERTRVLGGQPGTESEQPRQ